SYISSLGLPASCKQSSIALYNSLVQFAYTILSSRIHSGSSGKFNRENHVLATILERCDDKTLDSLDISKIKIEQLIEHAKIVGVHTSFISQISQDTSVQFLSTLVEQYIDSIRSVIDNKKNHSSVIASRVFAMQRVLRNFFATVQSTWWEEGQNGQEKKTVFSSAILAMINKLESLDSSKNPHVAEFVEALMRVICQPANQYGDIVLKDGFFIYTDPESSSYHSDSVQVCGEIIQGLQRLSNLHLGSRACKENKYHVSRRELVAVIKRCDQLGENSPSVVSQIEAYLAKAFNRYLPLNAKDYPNGFLQHVISVLLSLREYQCATCNDELLYISTPILQSLIQHIMNLEDTSVRNLAIEEMLQLLCTHDSLEETADVALEEGILLNTTTQPQGNQSSAAEVLTDMLQHAKEVKEQNISKLEVSHNPRVRELHASFTQLHRILLQEEHHLLTCSLEDKVLISVGELRQLLCDIRSFTVNSSSYLRNQVLSFPHIRQYLPEMIQGIENIIQSVNSRKELHLLRSLVIAINDFSNLVDPCYERSIRCLMRIDQKIEVCRDEHLTIFDGNTIASLVNTIQDGNKVPCGVMDVINATLEQHLPSTQKFKQINLDLFEHIVYECTMLAQPCLDADGIHLGTHYPSYFMIAVRTILQHLYSMKPKVAEVYYEKLCEILTFSREGISKKFLSAGEVITDVSHEGHIRRENHYATALENMLETSRAIIVGDSFLAPGLFALKKSYEALLEALDIPEQTCPNPNLVIPHLSALSHSLASLTLEERGSVYILLGFPHTLKNILSKLQTLPGQVDVDIVRRFCSEIEILCKGVEDKDETLIQELSELSCSIERVYSNVHQNSDYSSVTSQSIEHTVIKNLQDGLHLKDIVRRIVRDYMLQYFTGSRVDIGGVVKHFVHAIMGIQGVSLDRIDFGYLHGNTFRGEMVCALLEYLKFDVNQQVKLDIALQECKEVLCHQSSTPLHAPILRAEVIAKLDVEETPYSTMRFEANSLALPDSAHSKVSSLLCHLHEMLHGHGLEASSYQAITAVCELGAVQQLVYPNGRLREHYHNVLSTLLQSLNENGSLILNPLRQHVDQDTFTLLCMNLCVSMLLVTNSNDKALLSQALSYFIRFCNPQKPHPLAIYMELAESHDIQLHDLINLSLAEIREYGLLEDRSGMASPVLGNILTSLGLLFSGVQQKEGEFKKVDSWALEETISMFLACSYDFIVDCGDGARDFLCEVDNSKCLHNSCVSSDVRELSKELKEYHETVLSSLSALATIGYSGEDFEEHHDDVWDILETLGVCSFEDMCRYIESHCTKDTMMAIANVVVHYRLCNHSDNPCNTDNSTEVVLEQLLQALGKILQEHGEYSLADLITHVSCGCSLPSILSYMGQEDIPEAYVNTLCEYVFSWFSSEDFESTDGNTNSIINNLTPSEAKVLIHRLLVRWLQDEESLTEPEIGILKMLARCTGSLEWKELVEKCLCSSDLGIGVIEAIQLLYQYDLGAVEGKTEKQLQEYIKIIGLFAANVTDTSHLPTDRPLRLYLRSLCLVAHRLRKSDRENTYLYDHVTQFCMKLLDQNEDSLIINENRRLTCPQSLAFEHVIKDIE
ncbi:MAG: hypothetical protein K2M30_03115, partial [Desulfovibrionaceae bacterium]|nr:hypothetical protein [Desulfovibrionaceae bacterium]